MARARCKSPPASASRHRWTGRGRLSSPAPMPLCTSPSDGARTGPRHRRRSPRKSRLPSRLLTMGLLDDAIRDHLDLKRRRGADPTDIERAEREALGPVRRGPEETETEEPQFEEGLAYEDEHAAPYDE